MGHVFVFVAKNPENVESLEKFWRKLINHGLSVAAFTEDPNGGKPILAGLNVLSCNCI